MRLGSLPQPYSVMGNKFLFQQPPRISFGNSDTMAESVSNPKWLSPKISVIILGFMALFGIRDLYQDGQAKQHYATALSDDKSPFPKDVLSQTDGEKIEYLHNLPTHMSPAVHAKAKQLIQSLQCLGLRTLATRTLDEKQATADPSAIRELENDMKTLTSSN